MSGSIVSAQWRDNVIRRRREARHMTRSALARVARMDLSVLAEVECGEWEPTPPQIVRLARALGVTVRALQVDAVGEG